MSLDEFTQECTPDADVLSAHAAAKRQLIEVVREATSISLHPAEKKPFSSSGNDRVRSP